MNEVVESLERSAAWLRRAEPRVTQPFLGIVLGSGLGDLVDELSNARVLPYEDIPGVPTTGVKGHDGGLYIGELEGATVVAPSVLPVYGLSGVGGNKANLGIYSAETPRRHRVYGLESAFRRYPSARELSPVYVSDNFV